MWLSLEVLSKLLQTIKDFNTFALIKVTWLKKPKVLLQMFWSHPLVVVVPPINLLEFLFELKKFGVTW